jgi:hypothetical protein
VTTNGHNLSDQTFLPVVSNQIPSFSPTSLLQHNKMQKPHNMLYCVVLLASRLQNSKDGLQLTQGFPSSQTVQLKQYLNPSLSSTARFSRRRPYELNPTTEEKQKLNGKSGDKSVGSSETQASGINGDVTGKVLYKKYESPPSPPPPLMIGDFNASAQVIELMDEISRRINEGSTELVQNITNVVDEQMTQLPESAANELAEYLGDFVTKIQKAQMEEVQRQMEELEKIFVSPLERVAFSDAPLFELDQKKVQKIPKDVEFEYENKEERNLILTGANSTLTRSARMRTAEIIRNFNVAPMYYSVALLYRWFRKASVNDNAILSVFLGMRFI